MITLYPYQQKLVDNLKLSLKQGKKRLVLCLPTGGGKTVVLSHLIHTVLKKRLNVLFVAHRKELLERTNETFYQFNLYASLIVPNAEVNLKNSLHLAMVETLARRIKSKEYQEFIKTRSVIIIDECHLQNFDKLHKYFSPNTIVIGATATPLRTGKQTPLSELYQDIVMGNTVQELIDMGNLATPHSYGSDIDLSSVSMSGGDYDVASQTRNYKKQQTYKGVVKNYKKICQNEKTILFAPSIEASKTVTNEFLEANIPARHLDGEMTPLKRQETLRWFKTTKNAVLSNVGVLTAGFDLPDIRNVILYRATKSLPLFLQMVGRAGRKAPNKTHFRILDFGNNIKTHGYWEQDREWSLYKPDKIPGVAPVKLCPHCEAINPSTARICKLCKKPFPEPKKVEPKEITLDFLMTPAIARSKALNSDNKTRVAYAKKKLINPYWVLHSLQDYDEAQEFCNLMGYKSNFLPLNKERFGFN